jgi:hypothetical protein
MSTLRSRVWALVAALALAGSADAQPSPPPETVRGKKTEVFNRPEFKPKEPGAGGWFWRQIRDFFIWLGSLYDGSPFLFWVMLIGCLLLLALMIGLMAYQIRSAFVLGGRSGAAARDQAAHRLRLSVAHREEADRLAAAGDYTEAVRYLFLSLIYRFDERGRVSLHKDYTNREYLDLVGDRLPVRDALRVMVDTLDDHWYAQRPCDRERYEACLAVYNRLVGA